MREVISFREHALRGKSDGELLGLLVQVQEERDLTRGCVACALGWQTGAPLSNVLSGRRALPVVKRGRLIEWLLEQDLIGESGEFVGIASVALVSQAGEWHLQPPVDLDGLSGTHLGDLVRQMQRHLDLKYQVIVDGTGMSMGTVYRVLHGAKVSVGHRPGVVEWLRSQVVEGV